MPCRRAFCPLELRRRLHGRQLVGASKLSARVVPARRAPHHWTGQLSGQRNGTSIFRTQRQGKNRLEAYGRCISGGMAWHPGIRRHGYSRINRQGLLSRIHLHIVCDTSGAIFEPGLLRTYRSCDAEELREHPLTPDCWCQSADGLGILSSNDGGSEKWRGL